MKKSSPKSIDDLVGKDGVFAKFLKPFIEEISKAELDEHLGYEKHSVEGYNSRKFKKWFLSEKNKYL